MTDQVSVAQDAISDSDIQWTQATSRNGVSFEFGLCKSEETAKGDEATGEQGDPEAQPAMAEHLYANTAPTPRICQVHWPVNWAREWQPATGAESTGILQYQLHYDGRTFKFYDYRLTFIITSGSYLQFKFEDKEGDTYTVMVWELGMHFVRFNSKKLTIVKVTETGNRGPVKNFVMFIQHGRQQN
ncbi:hypothetical protein H0H92_009731 [Tricholoma furcatifolium]|nr:hypothetical protein H0H92_009731 [Tricholoma furcatifolium]